MLDHDIEIGGRDSDRMMRDAGTCVLYVARGGKGKTNLHHQRTLERSERVCGRRPPTGSRVVEERRA